MLDLGTRPDDDDVSVRSRGDATVRRDRRRAEAAAPIGNPGPVELLYLGCTEAADRITKGMDGAIAAQTVSYDFARLTKGAKEVKCSEFGDAIIAHMK